jgi:hypothetical protein
MEETQQENILTINDNWRLTSDRNCWTLQKKGITGEKAKVPNQITWDTYGYFSSLSYALEWLAEEEFKSAKNLGEVVTKIKELKEFFGKALKVVEEMDI